MISRTHLFALAASALAWCASHASPAPAATLDVPSPFPTIQAALGSATAGDTVLVACGTYVEHDLVMKSGVVLRSAGGLASCVTIDAARQGRVLVCVGVNAAARVEGITIVGGLAPGPWPDNLGGGVYCEDAFLTFADCAFSGNEADTRGGAVFCADASPAFERCAFSDNVAGEFGGAISVKDASFLTVAGGSFTRNSAKFGACLNFIGAAGEVTGSLFWENASREGGGMTIYSSAVTVTDCAFWNNTALWAGGAIHAHESSPLISRCTFYGNGAGLAQGATLDFYGAHERGADTPVIERCVIAFAADGLALHCDEPTTVPVVTCTNVYGNQGGDWTGCVSGSVGSDGNFSADPLFCDAEAGDLSLAGASPCLPGNHPSGAACGRIGAFGPGPCAPVGVRGGASAPITWGSLRSRF